MLSPTMTVIVLCVLWLIVVVPMIFRRDRRADSAVLTDVSPDVSHDRRVAPAAERRPVPVAQEALMSDRTELSAARAQMMARRRRSLGLLIIGTVLGLGLEVVEGGSMWLIAVPFLLGLFGYVMFLRSQARRDRERRRNRTERTAVRRSRGLDVADEPERFEDLPESVVRIDDDDIELQSMDTIDLTGLYTEDLEATTAERRAS